jgi:squalene cyclase
LAIVVVGGDPATFDQGGNTPLTYLAANAGNEAIGGDVAKLILAAIAVGENPRSFGGVDSVKKLEGMLGDDGKIGVDTDTLVGHSLAILALKSAQRPIPAASLEYITAAQQENGAWAWDATDETAADTNTTAFVVQALMAAGEQAGSTAVTEALAYYRGIQNEDGGWPYQNPSAYGTDTDANSTAVTIQALIAAGQDPAGDDWILAGGNSPLAALEALQNESGAFAWQVAVPDDNLLATVQALPALAGRAFPLAMMEVGDAATDAPLPDTAPETGASGMNLTLLLVGCGAIVATSGYALSRKR